MVFYVEIVFKGKGSLVLRRSAAVKFLWKTCMFEWNFSKSFFQLFFIITYLTTTVDNSSRGVVAKHALKNIREEIWF